MSQITQSAVHCINPHCHRPYPQPWGNKFCNSCGAPLQLLDRYYPIQPLGVGGFAQIYTIWDEKAQTEKVLKVLVEDSPKALELFTQEAAVLSSFRHPGIPRVEADGYFHINLANPKPYQLACLVMEKINGQTLEEVRRHYPQGCPEDLVLSWFTQAVEILQELHQRKIIHRDIKPSNLMLRNSLSTTSGNQLVIIDFGGAKQFTNTMIRSASSSTRLYSSGYSPPEQVTGANVSPVADFYALGRTIIELLTGKYPPDLEDPHTGELRWRHQRNVNPRLADLLDEMIRPDVKLRPANAAIIQKRLVKISPLPSQIQPTFTPKSQLLPSLQQTLTDLSQGITKTTVLLLTAITKSLIACIATTWAIILGGFSSSIGVSIGFILADRTNLGDRLQELLFYLTNFGLNIPDHLGSQVVVVAVAGLGTAWGITISGCFGLRRQFLVASLMGMISYGLSWIIWQCVSTTNNTEALLGWMSLSIALLTINIGLRSHQIVYAFVAAFGSTWLFSFGLGVSTSIFYPESHNVLHLMAFFGLLGMLISFWLGVTYYLIVPALRQLGWR